MLKRFDVLLLLTMSMSNQIKLKTMNTNKVSWWMCNLASIYLINIYISSNKNPSAGVNVSPFLWFPQFPFIACCHSSFHTHLIFISRDKNIIRMLFAQQFNKTAPTPTLTDTGVLHPRRSALPSHHSAKCTNSIVKHPGTRCLLMSFLNSSQ